MQQHNISESLQMNSELTETETHSKQNTNIYNIFTFAYFIRFDIFKFDILFEYIDSEVNLSYQQIKGIKM